MLEVRLLMQAVNRQVREGEREGEKEREKGTSKEGRGRNGSEKKHSGRARKKDCAEDEPF